ncbi:MAG: ECF transporter S component [Clostridiales bacterium]|nr:ECF transporter S component [Clostridiales bacterium]
MNKKVRQTVLAAFFLALALVLPFLTGQIPQVGQVLSPMHIPVLLCGFVCGGPWGMLVGFVAPLLRNLLFHAPPYPMAAAMAFELAAYGLLSGLIYKVLPKKIPYVYVTLILSMLGGRLVWGLARYGLAVLNKLEFSFDLFLKGAFITAWPGIVLHLLIIPPLFIALKKAKLMPEDQ